MQIRIEASDLPGSSCGPSGGAPGAYHRAHVGARRRNRRDELLGLVPGDASSATWTMDCRALPGPDGTGLLVGRLGLTDAKGKPLCAPVRPPVVQWSAG